MESESVYTRSMGREIFSVLELIMGQSVLKGEWVVVVPRSPPRDQGL